MRAIQSRSSVTWDVPPPVAEKGQLAQHVLSHERHIAMDGIEQQKEAAEVGAVQIRPEITKYEIICSYRPKGKLIIV